MVEERYPQLPTALLADASPVPIAMRADIGPVFAGAACSGPAFTVWTPPGEHPSVREAAVTAPAGSVLVVAGGGYTGRALFGDRMAKLALARGVAGLVVDGAVRDSAEIEACGFPAFAAAATPTPPRRELQGKIGVHVSRGGVAVAPGDGVVGDRDGVVVVATADADALRERALELLAKEDELYEELLRQAGLK